MYYKNTVKLSHIISYHAHNFLNMFSMTKPNYSSNQKSNIFRQQWQYPKWIPKRRLSEKYNMFFIPRLLFSSAKWFNEQILEIRICMVTELVLISSARHGLCTSHNFTKGNLHLKANFVEKRLFPANWIRTMLRHVYEIDEGNILRRRNRYAEGST